MNHLVRWSDRRCSMVFVIILVIFGSLFASSARANTTWTVTVDVTVTQGTGNNIIPTYSISPNPANTPNCAGSTTIADPSQGDVQICAGDTIYWTFVTKGRKGWLRVHQKDGVLKDSNSNSIYFFHKKERDTINPGGTTKTSEPDWTYTYCVAVHDDNGGATHLYTHDPKVIIGKGSPIERFSVFINDCSRLAASITNETKAKEAKHVCQEAEDRLKKLLPEK